MVLAVADSTEDYGTQPVLGAGKGKLMIARIPSGELRELLSFEARGRVRNLQWGPDGTHVYFTESEEDKTTLRRVPVEGGEAEQVWLSEQSLYNFAIGPKGQRVAYTVGENVVEIYVMENLAAALSDEE